MVFFWGVFLLLWQMITLTGWFPSYILPSPVDVLSVLITGIFNKTILIGLKISVRRLILGFLLSVIFGFPLGVLIGRREALQDTLGSLVQGLQALPSICWFPLAVLWFGVGEHAIMFIVIMGGILPVIVSADAGVKQIPPIYVHAARTMGAKGVPLFTKVLLPAMFPFMVTGMKLGWAFAWRALMSAELLFGTLGLGHLLMAGRELNDMSQVMAIMIVIVLVGLAMDRFVFAPLEKRIRFRWGMTV